MPPGGSGASRRSAGSAAANPSAAPGDAPRSGPRGSDESAATPTGASASPPEPLLATSVVGSYSVPEWLERLKTDFYQRRISGAYMQELHEVGIKAAFT